MLSDGIGSLNESTLHAAIKEYYARDSDRFEVSVDGHIIDIARGPLLIEIQTSNFTALRRKLSNLTDRHKIHLLYPIPARKWIVRVSESGDILGRRKSPRRGKLIDLFDELLHIPELVNHPNFSLEVLMLTMDEIRCDDGKGSWRRKGVSIKDRRLAEVVESVKFNRIQDFLRFIPDELNLPFTNKDFSRAAGVSVYQARRITYTMRRMGLLKVVGKEKRSLLYEVSI